MIKYADFIFGNEDEFKAWGEAHEYKTDSLLEVTARISKLDKINKDRPRVVICTQGKLPVLASTYDFFTEISTSQEYPVTLIPADKVVDLNGAGDAFTGGFLA